MDNNLESIYSICGTPKKLLVSESNNIAIIKLQDNEFKKKLGIEVKLK